MLIRDVSVEWPSGQCRQIRPLVSPPRVEANGPSETGGLFSAFSLLSSCRIWVVVCLTGRNSTETNPHRCALQRMVAANKINTTGITRLAVFSILGGCAWRGPVYHQPNAKFANLTDGNHLKREFASLRAKFKDDHFAIATALTKRGASCASQPPAETDRSETGIVCYYFFCDGNSLQTLQ